MPTAKKPSEALTQYFVYNPFSKFLTAIAYWVCATHTSPEVCNGYGSILLTLTKTVDLQFQSFLN